MLVNTISPFSGKPRTRRVTGRDGRPQFIITPAELTPLRARAADLLGGVSAAGLFVAGVVYAPIVPAPAGWVWLAVLVSPWAAYPLLKHIWRYSLKKPVRMVMTANEFVLHGPLGAKKFDRSLPHKFALVTHDKALDEREAHEFEVRKAQMAGKAVRKTRYYGKSWHLSYEQLGQRFDLITIYGQKEARRLRDRLKACDEVMDAEARKSGGTALNPEEQWGDQPGDIPAGE